MMKKLMKKIEWKTAKGNATYTVSLRLEREINLDGDKDTVPCCEIINSVDCEGITTYISSEVVLLPHPKKYNDKIIVATIGKAIGITQDIYDEIMAAKKEIENHPAWIAKQENIASNEKENEELYATRVRNGYCPKCGSYCYGDCEA